MYGDTAGLLRPDAIIATNHSTLLPRDFAEAIGPGEKDCVTHFANLTRALDLAAPDAYEVPEVMARIMLKRVDTGFAADSE